MMIMRVACLQMRSGIQVEKNLETLEQMVAEAARRGAKYIQTPEMTSLVQKKPKQLFANIQPDEGRKNENHVIDFASRLAKRHKIWLHLGSIAIRATPDKAANRGILFSPAGRRVANYDKLHMFDVDLPNNETWRESSLYQAGDKALIVETDEFILGMSICYDLRFPGLYRSLAAAGAQILTCPAAFTSQTGKAHWHTLLRARAIENGAFVIAAAQGGEHEDGRNTYGHSLIINPWGEIIAELDHDNPQVLICDIVLSEVNAARTRIPSLISNADFTTVKCSLE
ncbi:MAG: carbon-nitrogen hydrolase family protein [Rhizobiaceae bacterium]|nr:carbon-nitrogen hydrolase family protein [Rhizobiaceae bacterium]